ncbi:hypothetical protein [Pseudoalteromonas sp. GB56]
MDADRNPASGMNYLHYSDAGILAPLEGDELCEGEERPKPSFAAF